MKNKKTTYQKLLFFSLLFFIFYTKVLSAQTVKQPSLNPVYSTTGNLNYNQSSFVSCDNKSEGLKKYNQQAFYVPTEKSPVITLKITIHVFKPLLDTGRWQMNDNNFNGIPALKYMFDSITNGHQERFSVKRKASYYVANFKSNYIYDSKIQYEITNIYFYSNLSLYTQFNDEALFSYIEKTDSSRLDEGLPIVFNGSSAPGHLSSYKGKAAVVTTLQAYDLVFGRSHLLHEIGHAFGLGHTYVNSSGAGSDWQNFNAACNSDDYLSDVFPNNNPFCQNEGNVATKPNNAPCLSCYESSPDTSNNLMGGQRYNLWLSPLQMGRRIRSMHLNSKVNSHIRQFAKEVESDHKNTWNISANETWDFDIQMYNDIIIKAGVTLTVKCKIAMAINGKIKLEKSSKLVVDGGEITGWCKSDNWFGVELLRAKKTQNKSTIMPITLLNGGVIKKAKRRNSSN